MPYRIAVQICPCRNLLGLAGVRSELSQWWTSRGVKIQLTPSTNSDPVRNAGKHLGKASDANKNQGNAEAMLLKNTLDKANAELCTLI